MTHPRPTLATRTVAFATVALLALVALASGGCGSGFRPADQTPMQRATAISRTFELTVDALTAATEAGYLPRERARELVPYVDAANAARRRVVRAAREGSADGINSDFRLAVNAFNDAFDVLLSAQDDAEQTKAAVERVRAVRPPATGPTAKGPPR